ncbi:c-type cytochrome [Desulfuromonas versatilis]|uniref:C-type cytochrome n=3 Tax=Desulfuromonas versatilis TaxID=2802975 RepID=A0ABM8HZU7_9BACT|nr:c-type cytochrome [Desulfuromonas versatilis]
MKITRTLMLAALGLAVVALPVAVSPGFAGEVGIGRDGTIAAQRGKATTIAELVAMYDSSSCEECHTEVHEEWMKSAHARSIYGTGRTAATFRTTIINGCQEWPYSGVKGFEDVKVEHLQGCTKCHLPQLADATDEVAQELMNTILAFMDSYRQGDMETFEQKQQVLQSLNINCLVCHNRMAITHKWTDGYPQDGVVYGAAEGEHDDEKFPKMAVSPIMSESILCGQCHGLGPNLELDNPTQCATAYGSYLWAYTAEGGRETCQECHMKKSGLGHNMQSYRDPGMAEAALDFDVEAYGMHWRDGSLVTPTAVVKVAMTNKSGHSIPDG